MEFYKDNKNREIHDGALVKVYHFTGGRRKKYYMYKLIRLIDNKWMGIHLGVSVFNGIPDNRLDIVNNGLGYFLPFTKVDENSYKQVPKKLEDYEVLVGPDEFEKYK